MSFKSLHSQDTGTILIKVEEFQASGYQSTITNIDIIILFIALMPFNKQCRLIAIINDQPIKIQIFSIDKEILWKGLIGITV